MLKNKNFFIFLFILLCTGWSLYPQEEELLSAKALLEKLSNQFKENTPGFKADFVLTQNDETQEGVMLFKNPQKLRIDFKEPEDQVICTNGYDLWLYMPTHNFVLHQTIMDKEKKDETKQTEGAEEVAINPILINPVGFERFLTDYAIEYFESKKLVEYTDGAMVYQFKLIRWRSSRNGFNVVYLTVQNDGLVRKVDGVTAAYRHVVMELNNPEVKNDLSDLKFNYDPPAHARTVENFISNQGELK